MNAHKGEAQLFMNDHDISILRRNLFPPCFPGLFNTGYQGMNMIDDSDDDPEYEMRIRHYLDMLKDADPSRRWKAAEGLARLGDERAVDPLIDALSDEDWRVRQKAAWALGRIGDQRALLPLRRALLHESEGVKEIIMESLDLIKRMNR
jgi:hypothetical protein